MKFVRTNDRTLRYLERSPLVTIGPFFFFFGKDFTKIYKIRISNYFRISSQLYFITAFNDMKFLFRFASYLSTFISQIISVFRARLPRNEIQNVPFRCVENFRNPSSSSNNLNKIHLKFIRSYLLDIKIVLCQRM